MKALFWIGLVVVILGGASLLLPIPHRERKGFKAGGVSIGIETRTEEKLSPVLSAVLILSGTGFMIVGRKST